jgi:hypothetical protein
MAIYLIHKKDLTIFLYLSRDLIICCISSISIGIAKPTQFAQDAIAVFIQITFQFKLTNGHQLFPGFIGASVCISQESISLEDQY